jgi:tRNA-splicing ligase RtcB
MNAKQLIQIGVPRALAPLAMQAAAAAAKTGLKKPDIRARITAVIAAPEPALTDDVFGQLAQRVLLLAESMQADAPRAEPVPYASWGDDIDASAFAQMEAACRLPVSVRGAMMPDAHVGYGLPVGGVLATENAVIPYAVGVDIACRMKLSVLDLPADTIERVPDRLIGAIEAETRFGIGANFSARDRREHAVMDEDWSITPQVNRLRDKAWSQLGSSGSGNHFVEFGTLHVDDEQARVLNLAGAGTYLALLSHSGSRGTGATICDFYSRLAAELHPHLDDKLRNLAWLSLDEEAGQEYWHAMNLMGRYAAANHEMIHHHIARHLGAATLTTVENHHNFAWKETHTIEGQPREVIVHRKGATPASEGVLGVIPGSMATPCYVVRGKGSNASLTSASHGAGRAMSRRKARDTFRWSHVKDMLAERRVHVISADVDEVPGVYKDIEAVMAAQQDLVEVVGRFDPRIVKMAPAGEPAED